MAFVLHFQSNTLLFYLRDCVLLVEYLINRTSFFLLSNKCPFELLYHKKLHMIIFRLLDVFLMISHCKVNVTNSLLGLEQLSFLDMILVVRAISFLNFPLTWFLSHAIFYFTKLFFLSNTHQV